MFGRLNLAAAKPASLLLAAAAATVTSLPRNPTFCDEAMATKVLVPEATKVSHTIDHTVLKPTTLESDVQKLCAEAADHGFAAVCVPPNFVAFSKQQLLRTDVQVATVIGFPFGYSCIAAKKTEVRQALKDGADEVDVVANICAIKNGQWDVIIDEIYAILPLVRKQGKVVKVIIESGILTDAEVVKCCEIYGRAGIDYLKTSTGYAEKGASIHHVKLFRANLPSTVKIKASGGIRNYESAKDMVAAGADRLGCSAGVAIAAGEKGDKNAGKNSTSKY